MPALELTQKNGYPAGGTYGTGDMGIGKKYALGCQHVQVRGLNQPVARDSHITAGLIIGEDEEQVGS